MMHDGTQYRHRGCDVRLKYIFESLLYNSSKASTIGTSFTVRIFDSVVNRKKTTSIIMAATQDYSFEGWMGLDKNATEGKMVWQQFPDVKKFEETDVDIEITHNGICGSDMHTLRSGWGPTPYVSRLVVLARNTH